MPTGIYVRTEEHKSKLRVILSRYPRKGMKDTPETREKKRLAQLSPETLEKNRFYHLGRKPSKESIEKKSESLHQWYSDPEHRSRQSRIHTSEERRKRSESLKKYYSSPESRTKQGLKNKGRKRSVETRKKISESKQRHDADPNRTPNPALFKEGHPCLLEHHSQKTKDRLSEIHMGELNPCWNGGSSFLPYPVTFNEELKRRIKERDGYICQLCECSNPIRLHIHHIDYIKENCCPENLITLCNSCNSKVNKNRQYWTKFFRNKLNPVEVPYEILTR